MQAILHVSNTAAQEIVDHLHLLYTLFQPLIKEAFGQALQRHGPSITDSTLDELVSVVMKSNVLCSASSIGTDLSWRKTFIQLPTCNASRIQLRATWTHYCVCSNSPNDPVFVQKL